MSHGRQPGRRRGASVAAIAAVTLLVGPTLVHAQDAGNDQERPIAQLETTAGRTFTGELVRESSDTVVLKIAGINTPFQRNDIAELEVGQTVTEEYDARRAELDPSNPEAWYQLAYFLFDRERYDAARREVEQLLAVHPNDQPAKRLRALIDSRILLRDQRANQPEAQAAERSADRAPAPRGPVSQMEPSPAQEAAFWLDADAVNKLRVWELPGDLAAAQPRVVVPRDVIDEFFERFSDDPALPKGRDARNRFRAQPGWEQLDTIFRLRARDLYPRVQVVRDPDVLQTYRGQINPAYVVGYFRRHFGTGQIPGLYLHRYRPNAAPSAFANFLTLGTVGYEGQQFINRATPARSLLLQWGLPRADADAPAPDVEGWRPFFTGPQDPRFQEYADWIGALYDPMPDYGIEYTAPSFSDVMDADPESPIQP